MKKQLLALAILTAGITNAQTWAEDFTTATPPSLPVGWLQNNVDGLTVTSSLATYSFTTKAWVSYSLTTVGYGKVAASTSWYSPAGTSNDWLISPSFTVPVNAVLDWEALAPNVSFPDGYLVKVSTTGTLTTDFSTTLQTVLEENSTWTKRGKSLAAFAGQNIRIAFVNNSVDQERLYMDNIKVAIPLSNDGNIMTVKNLSRYMIGAGNQNINGTFQSLGFSPVNNATLNYKVNSGAVVTQTITFGTALNYYDTTSYSFTTPAPFAPGLNNVKIWVSQVNGINETFFANDTVKSVVYVASQGKTRNSLIEEFSSSTCSPCASLNSIFDPMVNTNSPNTGGNVNIIKNQVNWPSPGTDPSYNSHSAARVTFYGINAAPTTLIDGTKKMSAHSQAEIDNAKLLPAFATITASLSSTPGGIVTGSAIVTPYVTIANGTVLKVHQALIQSSYTYTAGTTSQKNYYHVMRKMFPSAAGTTVTTVDGTPLNFTFTHTSSVVATPTQGSYDFWNATNIIYEYVVFLQDQVSKDILQSGSATINGSVGLVELKDNQAIGIFPNPANEFAVVGIKLTQSSKVDVLIYDIAGKVVYSNLGAVIDQGQQELKINTSNFTSGTYIVTVNTESGILKDKLIINK